MLDKVLITQLEGIMVHSDMASVYRLMGWSKWMRFHQRQALEEMQGFLLTSAEYTKEAEMIPRPIVAPRDFFILASEVVKATSKEEQTEIHKRAIKYWHDWEETALRAYDDAIAMNPHVKILRKLRAKVFAELQKIP